MGCTGFPGTHRLVLTRVQVTHVCTVVTIVTWITAARVAVPIIAAVAVGRAWVGVTGIWPAAARLHVDALPTAGLQSANALGCLAYPHTLQTAPEATGHTAGWPRHSPNCNIAQVQAVQPRAEITLCLLLPIVKGQDGMTRAPAGSQCQLRMMPVTVISPAWLQTQR